MTARVVWAEAQASRQLVVLGTTVTVAIHLRALQRGLDREGGGHGERGGKMGVGRFDRPAPDKGGVATSFGIR